MTKKKKVLRNVFITLVCIVGALWAFRQINLERNKIRLGPPEEFSQACSAPIHDKIDAPYIFTGEVKSNTYGEDSGMPSAEILIHKVYKSPSLKFRTIKSGDTVSMNATVVHHDYPNYAFRTVGQKYLIFAKENKDDRLSSDLTYVMCNDYIGIKSYSEDEPLLKELVTSLSK